MNASRRFFLGKLAAGMALSIDRIEGAPQAALPAGLIHLQPWCAAPWPGPEGSHPTEGSCGVPSGRTDSRPGRPAMETGPGSEPNTAVKGANVGVVELSSWHVLYMVKIQAAPFIGSFFLETVRNFISTGYSSNREKKGRNRSSSIFRMGRGEAGPVRDALYQTTRGQRLLTLNGIGVGASLSLVELPDYREIMRVNLEDSVSGRSALTVVAAGGDSFVYGGGRPDCMPQDGQSGHTLEATAPHANVEGLAHCDFSSWGSRGGRGSHRSAPKQNTPLLQSFNISVYDGAGVQSPPRFLPTWSSVITWRSPRTENFWLKPGGSPARTRTWIWSSTFTKSHLTGWWRRHFTPAFHPGVTRIARPRARSNSQPTDVTW